MKQVQESVMKQTLGKLYNFFGTSFIKLCYMTMSERLFLSHDNIHEQKMTYLNMKTCTHASHISLCFTLRNVKELYTYVA